MVCLAHRAADEDADIGRGYSDNVFLECGDVCVGDPSDSGRSGAPSGCEYVVGGKNRWWPGRQLSDWNFVNAGQRGSGIKDAHQGPETQEGKMWESGRIYLE